MRKIFAALFVVSLLAVTPALHAQEEITPEIIWMYFEHVADLQTQGMSQGEAKAVALDDFKEAGIVSFGTLSIPLG